MIRINLLGAPKPKRGKRGGVAVAVPSVSIPTEGPSIVVIALIVLAIFAGINYFYFYTIEKDQKKLQADLKTAINRSRRFRRSKRNTWKSRSSTTP
jgi:hypothetical protein